MKYVFEPLIGEKWTAIKEFDEYYISSFGRIWSQKKKDESSEGIILLSWTKLTQFLLTKRELL